MVYWDTSALLKLYVSEPESARMVQMATSIEGPIYSSAIVTVEVISALARKERSGELSRGGSREVFTKIGRDVAVGRIAIIPFGDDVVREAAKLVRLPSAGSRRVMIRALDLIHLASAVAVRSRSIVTTDARLRELAALAGMEVLPERAD